MLFFSAGPGQLVAAWFSLFDVIMLIILLPFFDRVIYPRIERRTGNPVSISWRILLGMIFAVAAMVVAGVVEHYRLRAFWPYPSKPCVNASIYQDIGNLGVLVSIFFSFFFIVHCVHVCVSVWSMCSVCVFWFWLVCSVMYVCLCQYLVCECLYTVISAC